MPKRIYKISPLGLEIKKRIIDMNISQADFCKQQGISRGSLAAIINGERLYGDILDKLKTALNLEEAMIEEARQKAKGA